MHPNPMTYRALYTHRERVTACDVLTQGRSVGRHE